MAQKKQFEENEDLILNINKFVDHKFEIKWKKKKKSPAKQKTNVD